MEITGFDRKSPFFPGDRIEDLDAQVKIALEKGHKNLFTADSLEEMAETIGVNFDQMQKSIDEYNGFCKKGRDDFFNKDPKFIQPVKEPRFYAFRLRCSAYGTLGGIKINERTEVISKDGKVIPGLYAGGYDANSL